MAFNFNWSPLTADAGFYTRARDLLTTALNKSPKPPIIVDDIIVTEFNLGSVPPDLEILEIGDLAEDRFRGIFKMCYSGDAFLTLKTRVQVGRYFLELLLCMPPGKSCHQQLYQRRSMRFFSPNLFCCSHFSQAWTRVKLVLCIARRTTLDDQELQRKLRISMSSGVGKCLRSALSTSQARSSPPELASPDPCFFLEASKQENSTRCLAH